MSDKFDNNMRGVLFPTFKAKDSERDYKGSCEIGGVEYWISAWNNRSKDQKLYISLRFSPKDAVMDDLSRRVINPQRAKEAEEYNDEIPF